MTLMEGIAKPSIRPCDCNVKLVSFVRHSMTVFFSSRSPSIAVAALQTRCMSGSASNASAAVDRDVRCGLRMSACERADAKRQLEQAWKESWGTPPTLVYIGQVIDTHSRCRKQSLLDCGISAGQCQPSGQFRTCQCITHDEVVARERGPFIPRMERLALARPTHLLASPPATIQATSHRTWQLGRCLASNQCKATQHDPRVFRARISGYTVSIRPVNCLSIPLARPF